LQRIGWGEVMLPAGRKIAPHATEDLGSLERPKATRDLLLHLGHADVVFALIVSKWHELVGHESQGFSFECAETLEEVA